MARQQQHLWRFPCNGRSLVVACIATVALTATVELGHGGVLLLPQPALQDAAESSDIVGSTHRKRRAWLRHRATARFANKRIRIWKDAEHQMVGIASFYSYDTQTASGQKFDPGEMACAHRTLPFGTRVLVTDLDTGNSVLVRVNDRGPYIDGRIVDLTSSAAERLGITTRGLAKVKLDVLDDDRTADQFAAEPHDVAPREAERDSAKLDVALDRRTTDGSAVRTHDAAPREPERDNVADLPSAAE